MKLLYHFIGINRSSDDDRYGDLLNILETGYLKPNPEYENFYKGELFQRIPLNKRFPVCFIDRDSCDDAPFREHMRIYKSQFAVGFEKLFILNRGGNPVLYLHDDLLQGCLLRSHFEAMSKDIEGYIEKFKNDKLKLNEIKGFQNSFNRIKEFLKPFNFIDGSNKNIYREREWRIMATDGTDDNRYWDFRQKTNIYNSGSSSTEYTIKAIIIPSEYSEKLKNDVEKNSYKYFSNGKIPDIEIA